MNSTLVKTAKVSLVLVSIEPALRLTTDFFFAIEINVYECVILNLYHSLREYNVRFMKVKKGAMRC